jgi:Kef-type K+ transport system membrane component KefB
MQALLQLVLIWSAVYFAAVVADRTRMTPVLFYLFFGALMANLGLLPEKPGPFIENLANLGIIIIMFALGFEEDTSRFFAAVRSAWGIALFGALGPFLAAWATTYLLFGNMQAALMTGLALAATTVSLSVVSMRHLGLSRSRAARLIMTSAVIDNISSLALVAMVLPIATGSAGPDPESIALSIVRALGFFAFAAVLGIYILPRVEDGWFARVPFLSRFSFAQLVAAARGEYAVLTTLLAGLAIGLIAHEFGLHPTVGAYIAGLLLREEYYDLGALRGNAWRMTKRVIDEAAFRLFGPVFFVTLGARIVLDGEILAEVLPSALALMLAVFAAQVASASLAARFTAGSSWPEALMIGFGMLGRAELAFVVSDIAYVQYGIISQVQFYVIMFAIFGLNIMVPLTTAFWKPVYVGRDPRHARPEYGRRPRKGAARGTARLLHEGRPVHDMAERARFISDAETRRRLRRKRRRLTRRPLPGERSSFPDG